MGIKISELNEYENAIDEDVIVIVDTTNSATKKITKANLLKETKQYYYTLQLESEVADNSEIEIPCNYEVR